MPVITRRAGKEGGREEETPVRYAYSSMFCIELLIERKRIERAPNNK